jgi:hypothetical protein
VGGWLRQQEVTTLIVGYIPLQELGPYKCSPVVARSPRAGRDKSHPQLRLAIKARTHKSREVKVNSEWFCAALKFSTPRPFRLWIWLHHVVRREAAAGVSGCGEV